MEATNHRVRPYVEELVNTDFFKYYYLDLYSDSCPLSDDSATCGNRACAVDTVDDESTLPEVWRASYLGQFKKNSFSIESQIDSNRVELSCVTNANERLLAEKAAQQANKDYCIPEDDRAGPDGVYVSLPDNPERYTGYAGSHANNVWKAVYEENCFGYTGEEESSLTEQEQCIEQRLFYRLLSGMHSSISTHLCYDYLNTTTGLWGPNTECFMSRVGSHQERLSNLYFNYALVSRAVAKLKNHVDDLQFPSQNSDYDKDTSLQILRLAEIVNMEPHIFNEMLVFSTPEALLLKEEFRNRFRKVSALMDCVGCDRCRLWGKLQAAGYGTALKIVFELNEGGDDDLQSHELISHLRRSELVSLINTFDRLSKSIEAVEYFRDVVRSELESVSSAGKRANTSFVSSNKKNVYDTLRFALDSYIPKNIWNFFVENSSGYLNLFSTCDGALSSASEWVGMKRVGKSNADL